MHRVFVMIKIVIVIVILSLTAFSQSIYMDEVGTGWLIAGEFDINKDIYSYGAVSGLSFYSVIDLTFGIDRIGSRTSDPGKISQYYVGISAHPLLLTSNRKISIAPAYGIGIANYKNTEYKEKSTTLGLCLYCRQDINPEYFLVFGAAIGKAKAELKNNDTIVAEDKTNTFTVGIDVCSRLKTGNIFFFNPNVNFRDGYSTTFTLTMGFMISKFIY